MPCVVQKYGGAAAVTPEQVKAIAQRIIDAYNANNDIAVVISARAGETSRLVDMVHSISHDQEGAAQDLLISAGIQISVGMLALAITSLGYKTKTYLSWQSPTPAKSTPGWTFNEQVDPQKITNDLAKGAIVIVAGFQGVDMDGNITTLGRGGGDISAVALAHAIRADLCEIYSDVAGIFTADQAICSKARKIEMITHEELLELASQGDRGIQQRALEYAKQHSVTIHVRSVHTDEPGTMVVKEYIPMEGVVITGIMADRSEAKIAVRGVPDRPGTAARILTALADNDISVDMIVQNVGQDGLADLTFSIAKTDIDRACQITKVLAEGMQAREVVEDRHISKVSIVGLGMKNHAGVAARMFTALAYNNINIQMISTSEIKISVAIDEKYTELAVRVLHEAFEIDT
jgi:aspartate kinase